LTPQFSTDPSWCEQTLTYSAPGLEDFATWNEATQTVDYTSVTDSLALSGEINASTNPELKKGYTVTITHTVNDYNGDVSTTTTETYDVTIKNPCIHQAYVTIDVAELNP